MRSVPPCVIDEEVGNPVGGLENRRQNGRVSQQADLLQET